MGFMMVLSQLLKRGVFDGQTMALQLWWSTMPHTYVGSSSGSTVGNCAFLLAKKESGQR